MPPISVNAGFGWTAAGAWLTALSVLGGIVTLIIRNIGPWKKQTTEAEERLRSEMWARIDSLESQVSTLRAELTAHHERCDKIIAEIRAQHGREMHELREQHLVDLAGALQRKMNSERPTQ